MAALHVGSARLLAGFDAVSGVSHAGRLEGSADYRRERKEQGKCVDIQATDLGTVVAGPIYSLL